VKNEPSEARKVRKIRISRDSWKKRAAQKQQVIKQLRGTVRDLLVSRDLWKTRVDELEQQVEVLQHEVPATSSAFLVFGG
jgi:hypothetical protein